MKKAHDIGCRKLKEVANSCLQRKKLSKTLKMEQPCNPFRGPATEPEQEQRANEMIQEHKPFLKRLRDIDSKNEGLELINSQLSC